MGRTQCRPEKECRRDISRVMWDYPYMETSCLSFILTVCRQTAPAPKRRAAYPPAMDEQPLAAGVFGLATHRMCGMPCRHGIRWALTPPFHPYRSLGETPAVVFCHICPDVAAGLTLPSMVLCVARTFLFMRPA